MTPSPNDKRTMKLQRPNVYKGSAATQYKKRIIGKTGFWSFLKYEFINFFYIPCPGALGLLLRKLTIPSLLKSCGKKTVFGRNITLRHPHKITLGANVLIDDLVVLDAKADTKNAISIADNCIIEKGSYLATGFRGSIEIGKNSALGLDVVIYGFGGVKIGENCMIAARSFLIPANHQFRDTNAPIHDQGISMKGITIEDNAWLGANVTVLDGVTIGRGAIIHAGAVVTRDIPPKSIAVGNPARVIMTLP